MILSEREKKIAVWVGVAAVAFVLYQFVLVPFVSRRDAIADDTSKVTEELKQADVLFARQRELKKVWAEMTAGGLKLDEGDARGQATNAVEEWAQDAGVRLTALKFEGAKKDGTFLVISFHATVTGSMRQMSKLTWALETAPIPVRVNDVRITPMKEGTDSLQAEISVSTLSMLPDADKSDAKTPVSMGAAGDHQ